MARKCKTCEGTGKIKHTYKCPSCFGEGHKRLRKPCPNKCEKGFYRIACPTCHGLGYGNIAAESGKEYISFDGPKTCDNCNGTGSVKRYCPCKGYKYLEEIGDCPKCKGKGEVTVLIPCPDCKGK